MNLDYLQLFGAEKTTFEALYNLAASNFGLKLAGNMVAHNSVHLRFVVYLKGT